MSPQDELPAAGACATAAPRAQRSTLASSETPAKRASAGLEAVEKSFQGVNSDG